MSRRDRDATRVACIEAACGGLLQRERRGEDPALTCPRCGEVYGPRDWAMLAQLQPIVAEPPAATTPAEDRRKAAAVLAGLRAGNRRGGPVQSLGEILVGAAERGVGR